jgi:phosphoglycerol transferase MdoB-like AlkP superfamily enzyme
MYSDYALQKFFEKASTMPWFKNTVFVITADHTSEAWQSFYKNRVGQYFIPIIFFQPGSGKAGHEGIVAQQTDIMPTLLDILHYPKPFVAFGGSLLRNNEPRFGLNYLNGNFQMIKDGYTWQTDFYASKSLYNFEKDSMLAKNLYSDQNSVAADRDKLLKAVIQQYNNRIIENKLYIQ